MPGFKSATDFDERRSLRVDCDKVFNGIIIGNGETICNITYLKNIGVSHVLNTATEHVVVNPEKYPAYDIKYHGFHVDDLPEANISRYFHTTTKFIDQAVSSGGLVVVNCVMGWSRFSKKILTPRIYGSRSFSGAGPHRTSPVQISNLADHPHHGHNDQHHTIGQISDVCGGLPHDEARHVSDQGPGADSTKPIDPAERRIPSTVGRS